MTSLDPGGRVPSFLITLAIVGACAVVAAVGLTLALFFGGAR